MTFSFFTQDKKCSLKSEEKNKNLQKKEKSMQLTQNSSNLSKFTEDADIYDFLRDWLVGEIRCIAGIPYARRAWGLQNLQNGKNIII